MGVRPNRGDPEHKQDKKVTEHLFAHKQLILRKPDFTLGRYVNARG